jgi:D-alanyl-D-alanine carboxypeptidase (penicillin-binding protein 5/6)
MEWGFTALDRRRLFPAKAVIGEARVQNGDTRRLDLVAKGPVAINLPRGSKGKPTATIRYEGPLRAPIVAGQEVAVLEVTAPGVAPARIPLFAAEAVAAAGPFDRIINAIAGLFA